jgi:hypothetical protein
MASRQKKKKKHVKVMEEIRRISGKVISKTREDGELTLRVMQ